MSADPASVRPADPTEAWFTPLRFGIGLALALSALFPDVLLGTGAFYYKDYGVLGYPVIHHHHERFWAGDFLPLWNPYSNCGAPFMAQWGTITLYPFSLFYLVLPLPWSLGVFCLAHLWFGGLGMYRLAASRSVGGFAATLAGVVFVFNGFTLSCLQWPNYTIALGWLPWVALYVERACAKGGRALVLASLSGTMQMLSGVPEFVVMTWLSVVALLGVELLGSRDKSMTLTAARRLGLVIALISCLSAAQLLPFFDLLSLSQRHSDFATEKWAMPWHGIGNFLVPLFHYAKTHTGAFLQIDQQLLISYYLGTAPLLLAAFGFFRGSEVRNKSLGAIGLISVILAMGAQGWIYPAIKSAFPQLGFVRFPIKFLMPLVLVAPLLAAAGLRWFLDRPEGSRQADRRLLGLSALVLLTLMAVILLSMQRYTSRYDQPGETLRNAVWRAAFLVGFLTLLARMRLQASPKPALLVRCGAIAILVIDIATHLPEWNPRIAAAEFAPGVAAEAQEFTPHAPRLGESRILISPAAEKIFLHSSIADATDDFRGKRLAFWSHLNLLDALPKVNGSSTLQLREQAVIQRLIYGPDEFDPSKLADFLAVSHETSPTMATDWSARSTALPLVSIGREPRFTSQEASLAAIAAGKADLKNTVLLPPDSQSAFADTGPTSGRVSEISFDPDRLEFVTEAEKPAVVVIAQAFHPGWKCLVNGEETIVQRANHAFQAFRVPAGRTEVRLDYQERGLLPGLLLGAIACGVCGILWRQGASKKTAGKE